MVDGAKLRRLRLARTLTMRELADRSGVNHAAISQIERGKRAPHPSTIRKLATALEVDPEALLLDVEEEGKEAA
jgi:transcriptional regulator with XRE-family HTH domain